MKLFQINYKRLVLLLLPTFLRRSTMIAFLRSMTVSIEYLYSQFFTNRNNNLYRLRMNGQVCYLRRVLNDALPEANNQISIDGGERLGEWLIVWDEDFDSYLHYTEITDSGTMVWDESAISDNLNNFVVHVPRAVFNANNDAKIRALLNEYKLLSKSYTIIYE